MSSLRTVTALAAFCTLAFTGVLGEPTDTGEASTGTGESTGPEDGVRQPTNLAY